MVMDSEIIGKIIEALGDAMMLPSSNKTEQIIVTVVIVCLVVVLILAVGHGVHEVQ